MDGVDGAESVVVGAVLFIACILLSLVVIGMLWNRETSGGTPRSVGHDEAEALFEKAVRLAQTGDYSGLCQSVAADQGVCRYLLQAAEDAGWAPGPAVPDIVAVTARGSALVLHLQGNGLDGSQFRSDFEVSWTGTASDEVVLRSATPIYWSGVEFNPSTCASGNGTVECEGGPIRP